MADSKDAYIAALEKKLVDNSKDAYIAALEKKLTVISGIEVEQIRKNKIANAQDEASAIKEMADYVDNITGQSVGTAKAGGINPQIAATFQHINSNLGSQDPPLFAGLVSSVDLNVKVLWDNNSPIYFPGQSITGRVQVNSYVNAKSIRIQFKGYCLVHWTEEEYRKDEAYRGSKGTKMRSVDVSYDSYEEYYKQNFNLSGDGCVNNHVAPESDSFNFSYTLPQNIPCSFESDIGKVQHELEVTIDLPMGREIKKIIPYSVNDLYDLNSDEEALLPIEKNDHKSVCCCCCRSGPVSFVLRVSRSGYVPGEAIVINAECTNMSNRSVIIKAKIIQKVEYHAEGKTKEHEETVAEKDHPEIDAGESDIWSGEQLLVPALPPSHLKHCSNINIKYKLKFKLSISGATSLEAKCPLIIGSIPLQQFFNNFSQTPALPLVNNSMSRQVLPDAPPALPLPSQHMPGPSMPVLEPYMPRQPVPWQPVSGQTKPENHISLQVIPPNSGNVESSTTFVPSAPVFPGMQDYPNMPPPSYSQSFFGLKKHDDDADDFNYVPHYVSYGLNNPQQNEEEKKPLI